MTLGARLEVVAGNAHGLVLEIDDDLVIGRHAEGPGRLGEDAELSRSHARVSVDGTGICAIEDLGSTNGTFINGLRITTPQALAQGDTVELGASTLIVRSVPPPASADLPTEAAAVPVAAVIEAGALSLRLEVDFEAREVLVAIGEHADPLRLVFDAGAWRAGSLPTEKGDPA